MSATQLEGTVTTRRTPGNPFDPARSLDGADDPAQIWKTGAFIHFVSARLFKSFDAPWRSCAEAMEIHRAGHPSTGWNPVLARLVPELDAALGGGVGTVAAL
ncbi:MAG TPA: hypothetical protein VNK73_11470, partial [Actinomycetota bacterium]|nr:hypothetical protein [Actinomycetota bacterium]